MANTREQAKRLRMQKLTEFKIKAEKDKVMIDREKLVSKMIVEHAITMRTALEEVNAVLDYDFN